MRAAVFLICLSACTGGAGDPAAPLPGSGNVTDDEDYPPGPYGNSTPGSVIENFTFPGYARPAQGIGEAARTEIALADFYNPTGEGTYGPDSPFEEGEPKPKALVINIAGLWCGPCKVEAAQLPEEYLALRPEGFELVGLLADTLSPGEPATFDELDLWVGNFDSPYPSVIDPSHRLAAPFGQSFPVNFIIDPRTMTIVKVVNGIPQESFWATVDELLSE